MFAREIGPLGAMYWAMAVLLGLGWFGVVRGLEPHEIDLKMARLLGNVPESIFDSVKHSQPIDEQMYEYINYSPMFEGQWDLLGYIIGMDRRKWDKVVTAQQNLFVWGNLYENYLQIKSLVGQKVKLIRKILQRPTTVDVSLIIFNKVKYFMITDLDLPYLFDDMVYYVNTFQLGTLMEFPECFVADLDIENKMKVVREDVPWDKC